MTNNAAFFISNFVMLLCILLLDATLYHFWPLWHVNESGDLNTFNNSGQATFYGIWVVLPYALLLLTNFFVNTSVNALMFLTFSALFFLGIALINYWYYMSVLSDGSSGLIFIVLPFLQLIGALVLIIVATIINQIKRK